ncbi:hypothetical protein M885DRAFT_501515 [Pelagophyceae sp. CCMP2097]|nr:hypothetical protein M885DRAFT_501515 [Pelagophyceae sp. CCMP2097]
MAGHPQATGTERGVVDVDGEPYAHIFHIKTWKLNVTPGFGGKRRGVCALTNGDFADEATFAAACAKRKLNLEEHDQEHERLLEAADVFSDQMLHLLFLKNAMAARARLAETRNGSLQRAAARDKAVVGRAKEEAVLLAAYRVSYLSDNLAFGLQPGAREIQAVTALP